MDMKLNELLILYIDRVLSGKVNMFSGNKKPHKSEAIINGFFISVVSNLEYQMRDTSDNWQCN